MYDNERSIVILLFKKLLPVLTYECYDETINYNTKDIITVYDLSALVPTYNATLDFMLKHSYLYTCFSTIISTGDYKISIRVQDDIRTKNKWLNFMTYSMDTKIIKYLQSLPDIERVIT